MKISAEWNESSVHVDPPHQDHRSVNTQYILLSWYIAFIKTRYKVADNNRQLLKWSQVTSIFSFVISAVVLFVAVPLYVCVCVCTPEVSWKKYISSFIMHICKIWVHEWCVMQNPVPVTIGLLLKLQGLWSSFLWKGSQIMRFILTGKEIKTLLTHISMPSITHTRFPLIRSSNISV